MNRDEGILNDSTCAQIPTALDVACYDKARKWITDFFSGNNDVVAVYEYGTVESPGLSDLDLMVVLKDEPDSEDLFNELRLRNVPEDLIPLITNDCAKFICRKHFKEINLLGRFRKILIYGEDIQCNELSVDQKNLLKIASVMDFLPERLLVIFKYSESKMVPVLDAIGTLNSYLYTAKETEEILGRQLKDIFAFGKELRELRQTWFNKEPEEQMKDLFGLMESGLLSGRKVIEELASYLESKKHYVPTIHAESAKFYLNEQLGFCFYSRDYQNNVSKRNRLFSVIESTSFLSVPAIWLSHFCFYGQKQGIISSKIRNNFVGCEHFRRTNVGEDMSNVLSLKINLCNEMASFLVRHGIPMDRLHRFAHIRCVREKSPFL